MMNESPVDDIFGLLDELEEVINKIRARIVIVGRKGDDDGPAD